MEPSGAMQTAVFAQLNGSLSVSVYDEAPLETPMPYAKIGDDAFRQDDSHGERGWIGIISIEVWDAVTSGRSRIKSILNEIDARMHGQTFAVAGYVLNYCRYQTSGTNLSNDQPLYRGIITYEVRLEQP